MSTSTSAVARKGEIAAIVFAVTLTAPPEARERNKILWVSRRPLGAPSDLVITDRRMDGGEEVGAPVRRVVERGPGPSTVDLPEPGCWRLSLRWADRVDLLDLRYRARSASSG